MFELFQIFIVIFAACLSIAFGIEWTKPQPPRGYNIRPEVK